MMLNLIIFGAPGSGKGTQSDLLIQKFGLEHISTGELLRKEIASESDLGKEADSYISKGNLVPDLLINAILEKKLDTLVLSKGIIFDGYPRTVAQALSLEEMLEKRGWSVTALVDLIVADRLLTERLLKRGETSGRSDDNQETIRKRLSVYHEHTAPVVKVFEAKNKYIGIEGDGLIDSIHESICKKINSF